MQTADWWLICVLVAISIAVLVISWRLYRRGSVVYKILLCSYIVVVCVIYAAALWVENKERYSMSETLWVVLVAIIFLVNVGKVTILIRERRASKDN